jgi:WD40 repeat protein
VENKSSKSRMGRFFWLLLLSAILSNLIIMSFAFGAGLIWIGVCVLILIPLTMIRYYLYNKSLHTDQQNNISVKPFRDLFLPWPKTAVWLAILVGVELIIAIPLFAYRMFPCSGFDLVRKANGCVGQIPVNDKVMDIAFSKDGKTFATYEDDRSVQIWSYPDLTLLNDLGKNWRFGTQLALTSNGEKIAICSYQGALSIFESKTGKVLHTLIKQSGENCDVKFTSDDQALVSISEAGLQTWDVVSGKLVRSIPHDHLEFLDISTDSKLLATGSHDDSIEIWNASDQTLLTAFRQPYLQSIAFSRDGKYLFALGFDFESLESNSETYISMINIWNTQNGKLERTLALSDIWAEYIAISEDGNQFVVGSDMCSLMGNNPLYEKPCAYAGQLTGDKMLKTLRIPNGINALAFSPTDDRVLVGTYPNLYVWQIP